MITELLPCPFCGSEADVEGAWGGYVPLCLNEECGCELGVFKTREEAVAAWSRRVKGSTIHASRISSGRLMRRYK